ncbi:MAG: sel1 repeat family protein, partial [Paraglaciecola chathamensis]
MLKLSLLFILSAAWLFTGRSDMACYLTFLNAQASLNEQAANYQATFHYLYKAYLVGDPTALSRLSQQAIKQNSGYWLHFAKLAGSPQAQRYFSDLQGNTKQSRASIKVLSYAAQQDDIDAQVALYHHFVVKNQRQKAQYWLTKAASRDAQSALYYAKWLSIAGQERKARALLNKAAELGSRDAVELLSMRSSANIARSSAKEQALATGNSQPSNNALHNAATTRCD